MRRPSPHGPTEARLHAAAAAAAGAAEAGAGAPAAAAEGRSSRSGRRRRASCAAVAASVMAAAAALCLGAGPAPALAYQLGAGRGGGQQQALSRHGLAQRAQHQSGVVGQRTALTRLGLSPSSSSAEEEPEGTRVEEALRVTTRQIRALQRLLDGFTEVPAANDPPAFPPQEVVLPAPTRDAAERDKAEIERLNREYYACLNGRDVKGLLALWRQEEAGPGGVQVQMYANEDKIVTGREEIDKHYDSRFRATWATNKHKTRLDHCTVEDERVFLRGINAFVTNKEVWENPKTRERKVMFATKVLAKSNGEWAIVHVHTGDGSQIEVNPNGQMKLTDGLRSLGQQRGAGQPGQGQNQLGAGSLGGLLGGGALGAGETSGFTADGREFRTITTPEGYRIILGSNGVGGIQGSLGGGGGAGAGGLQQGGAGAGRSGQETKEALLKALIQDLAKTGKSDMVPLQLGSGPRGGSRGGELFASSLDGGRGRRGGGGGGDDAGNLTRKTVAAIRQLCQEGKITVEQKQKLIFSIIRSTKREEVSQVEMAYDLLVENALAGEADAMFEFGEQCQIILESIDDELAALEEEDDDEDGAFEGQLFDDRRLR